MGTFRVILAASYLVRYNLVFDDSKIDRNREPRVSALPILFLIAKTSVHDFLCFFETSLHDSLIESFEISATELMRPIKIHGFYQCQFSSFSCFFHEMVVLPEAELGDLPSLPASFKDQEETMPT